MIKTTTSTRLIRLEDDFRQGFLVVNRDLMIDNGKAIERIPGLRVSSPNYLVITSTRSLKKLELACEK